MTKYAFPEGFVWGTATASYQIEGGVKQDGRSETIWDRFCQMPGNIMGGDNGDVANDHYNRFREDVKLIKKLGHKAYRFSVCWSRIMPDGVGAVNEKGIQFYSDLVDALLEAGIEPFLTIYHWDLPQALQDRGGWQNEQSIKWFTEYCRVLFERLGGRVRHFITLNEPFCVSMLGNHTGEHAPGIRDLGTAIRVSYNILRAHGAAVRLFRQMKLEGQIGITLNMTPTIPASDSQADSEAALRQDGYTNRWFLDPVLKGVFPRDMIEWYKARGVTLPDFKDEAACCEPIDFLGINYYYTAVIQHNPKAWPLFAEEIKTDVPHSDRGWPIDPKGLTNILVRIRDEYHVDQFFVTENGESCNDVIDTNGEIRDFARIDYLRRHFIAMRAAMDAGVNVRGYFVWSLYDNFEWGFGRYSRFGLVYENFDTQERIPKESAWWYKKVIEDNGFEA